MAGTQMSEGISLREFGRQVGLSGEGVRKAINTGRIPPEALGEITLSSGKKRPCISNAALAAEALGKNTDHTQRRVPNEEISRRKIESNRERAGEISQPVGEGGQKSNLPTITESKQIKEAYLARLARLEYEEKAGRLVDAVQLRNEMTNMIAAAKSKLLGVPSKAKGQLDHLTVSDIETLEEMISEALEELANGS